MVREGQTRERMPRRFARGIYSSGRRSYARGCRESSTSLCCLGVFCGGKFGRSFVGCSREEGRQKMMLASLKGLYRVFKSLSEILRMSVRVSSR